MPDFLTLKEASRHSGYHQDYIGQLIRDKKVSALRVGKSWLVDRQSLVEYLNESGKVPLNKEILLPRPETQTLSWWHRRKKLFVSIATLFFVGAGISVFLIFNNLDLRIQLYRLLAGVRFADFNKTINYQGKLRSVSNNQAVPDDDYNFTFRLYQSLEGGSPIWTESQTVPTKDGLFSVALGSNTTLTGVNLNQPLYLSVQVGGDDEMSPRKLLGAVPAAIIAEQLNGYFIDEFVLKNSTSTIASTSAETIITINQTGSGNIFNVQQSGSSKFIVDHNGYIGVSSSTPLSALSVSTGAGVRPFTIASSTGLTMLTVLPSGNVGINTPTPGTTLTVAGDILATGTTTATCFTVNGVTCLTGGSSSGGTVTSVGLTVPTGLSVSGSPITDAGTFIVSLTGGYIIPTTASTSNWDSKQDAFAVLSINKGGTGTTTTPDFGQLLIGDGNGGYTLIATSSLGIVGSGSASTSDHSALDNLSWSESGHWFDSDVDLGLNSLFTGGIWWNDFSETTTTSFAVSMFDYSGVGLGTGQPTLVFAGIDEEENLIEDMFYLFMGDVHITGGLTWDGSLSVGYDFLVGDLGEDSNYLKISSFDIEGGVFDGSRLPIISSNANLWFDWFGTPVNIDASFGLLTDGYLFIKKNQVDFFDFPQNPSIVFWNDDAKFFGATIEYDDWGLYGEENEKSLIFSLADSYIFSTSSTTLSTLTFKNINVDSNPIGVLGMNQSYFGSPLVGIEYGLRIFGKDDLTNLSLYDIDRDVLTDWEINLDGNSSFRTSGHFIFNGLLTSKPNLGIGTTSPVARLSVKGVGTTTNAAFLISDSLDVPKFTVLDNGQVGVGVSPTTNFEVRGGIRSSFSSQTKFDFIDSTEAVANITKYGGTNTNSIIDIDNILASTTANSIIRFFRTTNTTGQNQIQVQKGDGSANAVIILNTRGNTIFNNGAESGLSFNIRGASNNNLFFANATTNRIGVGTSSPAVVLDVYNNGDVPMFALQDNDGRCTMNPESSSIDTSCSSDEKLKENIMDANTQKALNELMAYEIREFDLKGSGDRKIGVVAQELEKVMPDKVWEDDGTKMVKLPSIWTVVKGFQYLKLETDKLGASLIKLNDKQKDYNNQVIELASLMNNALLIIQNQQNQITELNNYAFGSTSSSSQLADEIVGGNINLPSQLWEVDTETGRIKPILALDLDNFNLNNVRAITSASGAWSLDENGELKVKKITTEELIVERGITVRDRTTGLYTCIYVEDGSIKTSSGECPDDSQFLIDFSSESSFLTGNNIIDNTLNDSPVIITDVNGELSESSSPVTENHPTTTISSSVKSIILEDDLEIEEIESVLSP